MNKLSILLANEVAILKYHKHLELPYHQVTITNYDGSVNKYKFLSYNIAITFMSVNYRELVRTNSLRNLELPIIVNKFLVKNKITSMSELLEITKKQWLSQPSIGAVTVDRLIEELAKHGCYLKR